VWVEIWGLWQCTRHFEDVFIWPSSNRVSPAARIWQRPTVVTCLETPSPTQSHLCDRWLHHACAEYSIHVLLVQNSRLNSVSVFYQIVNKGVFSLRALTRNTCQRLVGRMCIKTQCEHTLIDMKWTAQEAEMCICATFCVDSTRLTWHNWRGSSFIIIYQYIT